MSQNPAPDGLRLRPTLVIGLGGTGHRIVVWLKALLLQIVGRERIAGRVKFLVFDTAEEVLIVNHGPEPVSLEPGSEFIDIGQTPVAKIKRNLDHQAAIRKRLGSVIASLPPVVLRNGAKQLRPLGLLALLWRFGEVAARLRDAIWELAGRQQDEGRAAQGVNVIIANSLVGGTGSSTFLDVAHLVRDLFDELGSLGDFCYITGVGVLPRAFHGVQGPNLVPNAVASLKELNHCMMEGNFSAYYPSGRTIATTQPPFNVYYLVDGIDERGHTWSGPDDVCRLAAEAIFLQMGTQVGQKQENDFDNLDDVLVQQTAEGDGTFYGSFGLASLVFPGSLVARACAARQAVRVIEEGLLAPPNVQACQDLAEDCWEAASLEPAHLADKLARDDQGLPLTVDLPIPGWADRLPSHSLPGELARYVRDYERARLETDFKGWLSQNEGRLATAGEQILIDRLTRLAWEAGLQAAEVYFNSILTRLEETADRLSAGQAERERQLETLDRDLTHQEHAFLQAGEGSFLGRGRRVARAQGAYVAAAQRRFSLGWQVQVIASALVVLNHLHRVARDALSACRAVQSRLKSAQRLLAAVGAAFDDTITLAGVTTHTLADEDLVAGLFEEHAPPAFDSLVSLRHAGAGGADSPLDWHAAPPDQLQAILLAACQPAFEKIAAMSVEDALALRTDEASPESIYRWLLDQATPSWNLERTRLPDGGAGLLRLEVLGVPDETSSLFRRYARNLVSTGDRSRLTAFVARIGAPHTALQQWESYLATYDQVRGRTPLHILPQFQADNERARQAFALGSIFRFITSEGSHFYYVPADHLAPPVKLAQGLAKALQAFIQHDGLVRETWDRVEQVVAGRGVEAILRTLAGYYQRGDGREPADDLVLELKRLVRAYAEELRQIHQFNPGVWPPDDGTAED